MRLEPNTPSLHLILTETEVEEFRSLAHQHTGAVLTREQARTVETRLLRVLAIIRDVATRGSSHSASPVDIAPLPESDAGAMNAIPHH